MKSMGRKVRLMKVVKLRILETCVPGHISYILQRGIPLSLRYTLCDRTLPSALNRQIPAPLGLSQGPIQNRYRMPSRPMRQHDAQSRMSAGFSMPVAPHYLYRTMQCPICEECPCSQVVFVLKALE